MPRQIQPSPQQYGPKKSNTGLKVLVIVLAVIALIAIGFAGWALSNKSTSSQPAAAPAKTVETKTDTKADTKTKDKVKSETKKDTKKDSNKDTKTKKETSKNPDGKNPTFDFDAMLGNDFSSANGRWEAPGGDVLTINDGIFLWEHDGKPFRAIYYSEDESKVPAEYREPNLKKRGYSTEFTTEGKNIFGKLTWESDDPNSNALIEIIFFPRDFKNGTLFQYKKPGSQDGSLMEARTSNIEHKQAIILLKVDHPEKLKANSLHDLGALRVKCEECKGKDRYYE